MTLSPGMIKLVAIAAVLAALVGWGLWERGGKYKARTEVEDLQGRLELCEERQRETSRAVTALGTATTAALARGAQLEKERARRDAPLVASIKSLEDRIGSKEASSKGCVEALREAREGK